jgi:hypothetical protein
MGEEAHYCDSEGVTGLTTVQQSDSENNDEKIVQRRDFCVRKGIHSWVSPVTRQKHDHTTNEIAISTTQ